MFSMRGVSVLVCIVLILRCVMEPCHCLFVCEVRYFDVSDVSLLTCVRSDRGELGPGDGNDDEDDQRPNDQSQ